MKKLALGILAAGVLSAHANLLTNGSFENNGVNMDANYGSWQTYTSITGWSNVGNDVEIQNNGLFGPTYVAADGVNWLELDSYGSYTLSQGFGAVAGQNYTLTFAYAGRPDTPDYDDVMTLDINGNVQTVSTTQSLGGVLNWQTASFNFTSNGADVISFIAGGPSDGLGMLLDNVVVDEQAVPEPASLGLFGMGLLAMLGFAGARSRKA